MITKAGGIVANDHIAFRSLRLDIQTAQGKVNLGIEYLQASANFLEYEIAGKYFFPDIHLYARDYRHPQHEKWNLPKLFISELIVEQLPPSTQDLIQESVSNFTPNYSIANNNGSPHETALKLQSIFTRPWQPPRY